MKKFILLLLIVLISSSCTFANNCDAEIAAIRIVKKAQIKVLDDKIKKHTEIISNTMANTSLSNEEKQNILKKEQSEILVLTKEKSQIEKQYKIDKKAIKKKY